MAVGQLEMEFHGSRADAAPSDRDALYAALGAFLGGLAADFGLGASLLVAVVALAAVLLLKRLPKQEPARRHASPGVEIVEVVEVLTDMDEQVRELRDRLDALERRGSSHSDPAKASA